ncbi:MAG: DUF397 domain-containing protein [Pseudonocardiaceae bacterium]
MQSRLRLRQGGNGVEIADLPGGHRTLRDSKNPAGPTVTVTTAEWGAFIAGVLAGEFD